MTIKWQAVRRIGLALVGLGVWSGLVLGGYIGYQRYQHLIADEATFHQVIDIVNENLKTGRLILPTNLQAVPAPAPAPALPAERQPPALVK